MRFQRCKATDQKSDHSAYCINCSRRYLVWSGVFSSKTNRSLPNPLQYKPSTIPPAAGGKKKERAVGGSSKLTSSFVPDFTCLDSPTCDLFQGVGSFAVTHDHWAGINTSKSWVHDILVPHYRKCCASLGLVEGTQKCVLLVDCWWGWLDEEFREWVRGEHSWVLLLYIPARCTPVAQPNDAGIIAMLKGEWQNIYIF